MMCFLAVLSCDQQPDVSTGEKDEDGRKWKTDDGVTRFFYDLLHKLMILIIFYVMGTT